DPARASVRTILGLVDIDRGRVAKMSGRLDIGECLTLSPDRKRAVATREYGVYKNAGGGIGWGGWGTTYAVHLVDLTTLRVVATLDEERPPLGRGERSVVNAVWSPDSRRVATVGSDHTARVWDGRTGALLSTLAGHTDWILSVC